MTGSEVVKARLAAGFRLDRANGSHHILVKPGVCAVSVPVPRQTRSQDRATQGT